MALFPFNSFDAPTLYEKENSTYPYLTCVFRAQSNRPSLVRTGQSRGGRIYWQTCDIMNLDFGLHFLAAMWRKIQFSIHGYTLLTLIFLLDLCSGNQLSIAQGQFSSCSSQCLWLLLLVMRALTLFLFLNFKASRVVPPWSKYLFPITPITITCLFIEFWWWKNALCFPKWQLADQFNSTQSLWVLMLMVDFIGMGRNTLQLHFFLSKWVRIYHCTSSKETDI